MPLPRLLPRATYSPVAVHIAHERLLVALNDGRWVSCPLWWFPRLEKATEEQRQHVELSTLGVHWPALDEDISVRGLLEGRGDMTLQSGLRRHFQEAPPATVSLTRNQDDAVLLALSDQRCMGVPLDYLLRSRKSSPFA